MVVSQDLRCSRAVHLTLWVVVDFRHLYDHKVEVRVLTGNRSRCVGHGSHGRKPVSYSSLVICVTVDTVSVQDPSLSDTTRLSLVLCLSPSH